MARPARAAATTARAKVADRKGKGKDVKREASGSDEGGLTESSTSSDDVDQQQDDYEEPDSDAIDDDTEDAMSERASDDAAEEPLSDVDEEDLEESISRKRATPKSKKVAHGGSSGIAGSVSAKKRSAHGKNEATPTKRRKKKESDEEVFDENASLDDDEDEEMETADGRKIIRTKLVKAPTAKVEAGLIDPHTMKFLSDLVKNNDREWFAKNGDCSVLVCYNR